MDEDGDGTVDFQEFTNAMTGTSKSAMDQATEWDIELLYRFFLDYGIGKHRSYALSQINQFEVEQASISEKNSAVASLFPFDAHMTDGMMPEEKEDHELYEIFKSLFDYKLSAFKAPGQVGDGVALWKSAEKRRARKLELLDKFLEENKKERVERGMETSRDKEFDELAQKMRAQREKYKAVCCVECVFT